jgi:predicted nucleic acid-binding protein
MTVLIDTDVLIDVALDRAPHAKDSAQILDKAQEGLVTGWLAWHSISNFYYIVSSGENHFKTIQFIKELLQFVKVAETGTVDALYATQLNVADFEDVLQIAAALSCKAQYIVTRNIQHYKNSPVPALLPSEMLEKLP